MLAKRFAGFARQGKNLRIGVQQTRSIELIQRRIEFAQGQIAQRAEQS